LLKTDGKLGRDEFFEGLYSPGRAALLLDYDGTLAPFQQDRHNAFPYPGVVAMVKEIIRNGRTRVVLVTGRSANEIIPLLGIFPYPEIWGSQGLQRLLPDGTYEMPQLDESVQRALLEAGEWLYDQDLYRIAEFKPGSIAVHWRGLPPATALDIHDRVLLGWVPIAERCPLVLFPFDGGLEMRAPGRNKGDAVRTILREMDERAPVAYLGDDLTDEDAFRALQHRGLTALVRHEWRATFANHWIQPPEELLEFLSQWLKACQGIR
jgi:trehalose 6-phosphate phosphatase